MVAKRRSGAGEDRIIWFLHSENMAPQCFSSEVSLAHNWSPANHDTFASDLGAKPSTLVEGAIALAARIVDDSADILERCTAWIELDHCNMPSLAPRVRHGDMRDRHLNIQIFFKAGF